MKRLVTLLRYERGKWKCGKTGMRPDHYYNRYYRMVIYIARKQWRIYGRNYSLIEVEDLIQEGFLELFGLYKSGKIDWDNPGVTNFIWKRVEGRIINFLTKIKKSVSFDPPYEETAVPENTDNELIGCIDDCLRAIPDNVDIFIMKAVDNMTFDEIAEIKKTYREDVRRKYYRIIESLIECLEKKGWEIHRSLKII